MKNSLSLAGSMQSMENQGGHASEKQPQSLCDLLLNSSIEERGKILRQMRLEGKIELGLDGTLIDDVRDALTVRLSEDIDPSRPLLAQINTLADSEIAEGLVPDEQKVYEQVYEGYAVRLAAAMKEKVPSLVAIRQLREALREHGFMTFERMPPAYLVRYALGLGLGRVWDIQNQDTLSIVAQKTNGLDLCGSQDAAWLVS